MAEPPASQAIETEPFQFTWRIHPVDKPDETAAELVFTQEADAETGSLEINAANPSMKSLVSYFLADPYGHRPLFFRDTGTVYGPHVHTFGQIDRSLMDFNREFPGFQAERVSEFPLPAAAEEGGE